MLLALLIFAVGLALSAFFSGSETGFYRVARVRLLIDALTGDRLARVLLAASNNPAAFVATALVGNNVANYVTALAIVMATGTLLPGVAFAEIGLTLLATPVIFIFGELLPKKLFFRAPYRLLRRCAPGLAVAGAAFAPFSLLLWLVSRLLEKISRAPAQAIRMTLARRELSEVLEEGHAVGLLTPSQRLLAQNAFGLGGQPLREFMTPATRQPKATATMKPADALRLAARQKQAALPVEDPERQRRVVGYVAAVDCLNPADPGELPTKPLPHALETEPYLAVLLRMQASGEPLMAVRNAAGKTTGYVATQRLRDALVEPS